MISAKPKKSISQAWIAVSGILLSLCFLDGCGGGSNAPKRNSPFGTLTLGSVSPTSGSTQGGTVVVLTGSNFATGATVSFGGVNAMSVTVGSPTQIMATTPAHGPGQVDVTVTNPSGQGATLHTAFTYNSPPTVSSVSPNTGPSAGGTSVTIVGINFLPGAQALFGGTAARSTTVTSSSQIQAVTPQHPSGPADVQVKNPDGAVGSLQASFTFIGPFITNAAPPSGPTAGGTVVTITGGGFQNGATVKFGGVSAAGVTFVDATTLLARTPRHDAAVVDITVTNPDGVTLTLPNGFQYPGPPTITGVSPDAGPTTGGTTVTITGSSFLTGAAVLFGTIAAASVSIVNTTEIQAVTPPEAEGAVDVTVTNTDGMGGTAAGGFAFRRETVTVQSLSREAGTTAGGTAVTITGLGFQSGATVLFGTKPATSVTVTSATQIRAVTPSQTSPGVVDVKVNNPDGSTGSLSRVFSYEGAPTTTYFNLDFEDGGVGNFLREATGDGLPPVASTDFAHSGSKSLKCVIGGTSQSISRITFYWGAPYPPFNNSFPMNPASSNSNGLYQRWYILFLQSAINNVVNNNNPPCSTGLPVCGQLKLLLNRGFDNQSNPRGSWWILAYGPEAPVSIYNELTNGEDSGVDAVQIWGTGVQLRANTWYEIETWFKRKGPGGTPASKGRAKMWINGKLVTDTGWLPGMGWDDSAQLVQSVEFGATYAQNQVGPLTVYIDDVTAADGFIEPLH